MEKIDELEKMIENEQNKVKQKEAQTESTEVIVKQQQQKKVF